MNSNNILKLLILVAVMVMIPACRQPEAERDPQTIRDSLETYRNRVEHLQAEIRRMERELNNNGRDNQTPLRDIIRVRVMEIEPTGFDHYFRINGSVEAIRQATISPEINGQMQSIPVNSGDRVSQGRVVARLSTTVIESNIEEVRTQLEMAEEVYERQERLWEQGIGSEIQYLEARNAYRNLQSRLRTLEAQLDQAIMRAPFPGIVDEIFIKEGELASPGMPVMQLVNLESLYINADISERYVGQVKEGENVILRFPFIQDFEARVPVHRLGNVINPDNRSFRLQLMISNPGERLKPNMVAHLSVRSFSAEDVMVVPSIYIKQDVQGHFLYVAREDEEGDWYAEAVYIERGEESEGKTVIESGLYPGDLLITDGHNRVGEGDRIEITGKEANIPTTAD